MNFAMLTMIAHRHINLCFRVDPVVLTTGVQESAGHFECEATWRGQHAWTSTGCA